MQSISDSFNESKDITNKYIKSMYVMGWGSIIKVHGTLIQKTFCSTVLQTRNSPKMLFTKLSIFFTVWCALSKGK